MKNSLIGIACLGLLVGLYGPAQANLITNGSFEDLNNTYSGGSYVTVTAGSANHNIIPGWDVVSGSIDWIDTYWQASEGSKSIDLAGYYAHGVIGTTFATEIGKTYRVQFDMAGNPDQGYDKSLIAGSLIDSNDNTLNFEFVYSFEFTQNGYTKQKMGWVTQYFDFQATSESTQLCFGDATGTYEYNQAWGAALDNVKVDLAPVPEPSTIFLLGAGLAGLGICGRRLRRPKQ